MPVFFYTRLHMTIFIPTVDKYSTLKQVIGCLLNVPGERSEK